MTLVHHYLPASLLKVKDSQPAGRWRARADFEGKLQWARFILIRGTQKAMIWNVDSSSFNVSLHLGIWCHQLDNLWISLIVRGFCHLKASSKHIKIIIKTYKNHHQNIYKPSSKSKHNKHIIKTFKNHHQNILKPSLKHSKAIIKTY